MKIALWIVQSLLAAAFLMAGSMKVMTPIDQLAAQMAWVADAPAWVTRLAGFSEVVGAFGLILPAATRIKPWLTPLAAAGLVTVMALGAGLHMVRGEFAMVPPTLVLGSLAAFIAWGRSRKAVIQERGVHSATTNAV